MSDIPSELQAQIDQGVALEKKFTEQMTAAKGLESQLKEFWKGVEAQMIDKNIKSIKGDWGSLTIAERLNWKTTEELPAKFYKKVVDTTKLNATFRLEGKEIKGAIHSTSQYLMKRIKEIKNAN